ncbi:MAG: Holliday junction branch migration protein RuvA [Caulobacteraceae bacterium]
MIGRLTGHVVDRGEEEVLIDVRGVGYIVRCGTRTLMRLPAAGEEAVLHIETQWTDSSGARLYGFLSKEDRSAFVLLQSVQGVGPKAALAMLDVLSVRELTAAIARGDRSALARANGVGPKLAQRIVSELKERFSAEADAARGVGATDQSSPRTGDAVAVLLSLGWAESDARRAVERAAARLGDSVPEAALIKTAIQDLGK